MGICVLGLGYVGLTLGVTLAKVKPTVYGIDVDKSKIQQLSEGKSPIYEPGLQNILRHVIKNGSFKTSHILSKEIANDVDTYILCIGTPIDNKTKKPLFNHLEQAIIELSSYLKKGDLVILRSTVTVGTAKNMVRKIIEEKSKLLLGQDFFLASAPERTVEGMALQELNTLPQIIGSSDEDSINRAANIFNKITKTIIRVSSFEAAEIIKLLDNTSRDVNIALGNQFGLVCEKLGLNSKEIVESANYGYPRNKIFIAGAGVGGQCLVKDPYFLIESVKNKLDLSWIETARKINDSMPEHVIELIVDLFKEMSRKLEGSRILILGFAFKGVPETDDTRYSPALPVVDYLKKNGVTILGYDPKVEPEKIKNFGVVPEIPNHVDYIDCIVIMNNNNIYKEIDYEQIKNNSTKPIGIVDGWQLLDPNHVIKMGYCYRGVGIAGIKFVNSK